MVLASLLCYSFVDERNVDPALFTAGPLAVPPHSLGSPSCWGKPPEGNGKNGNLCLLRGATLRGSGLQCCCGVNDHHTAGRTATLHQGGLSSGREKDQALGVKWVQSPLQPLGPVT